ncbi:elongation factor Ts [Neisseria meningitidis]|nr:elongation factor Ts [Neisseria meningitidis]
MPLFSNMPSERPFAAHDSRMRKILSVFPKNLGDSKWQKLLTKWLPTCAPLPAWA